MKTTASLAGPSTMLVCLTCLIVFAGRPLAASRPEYHDPRAVVAAAKTLASNSSRTELHELALTHGGQKLRLLEIAPAGKRPGKDQNQDPAILVIGNPLGTTPLATEAALRLAGLISDQPEGSAALVRWYIIPSSNPDGAENFFTRPQRFDGRNARSVDQDKDGESGEDPADDLNGDGLITSMLVADPEGTWLLSDDDPPLPREAVPSRNECGLYSLVIEGADQDMDGQLNEDGPGGVVPGRNFPHSFTFWQDDAGRWAASEPESRAILRFAYDHPEIAMVLVLGAVNTLAVIPEADAAVLNPQQIFKVRSRMARRIGVARDAEFTIRQMLELRREQTGNPRLRRDDVLRYLDVGMPTGPSPTDLVWWSELGARYREILNEAGLAGPRIAPATSGAGSIEQWAYFQYGVPGFALDFWSVPLPVPPVPVSGDSTLAAIAPVDSTTLAEQPVDDGIDPDLKALVAFSTARLDGKGFRAWQEVQLPDDRRAFVGGEAPYARHTPPAAMIDSLLTPQLPFILELADWLPGISLGDVELEHRGADVYDLTAYIANSGRLPYPTAHGIRCRRIPPVVITLDGVEILEQRARQVVTQVPAKSRTSVRWLVRGKPGATARIVATAPGHGESVKEVKLDREGGRR